MGLSFIIWAADTTASSSPINDGTYVAVTLTIPTRAAPGSEREGAEDAGDDDELAGLVRVSKSPDVNAELSSPSNHSGRTIPSSASTFCELEGSDGGAG